MSWRKACHVFPSFLGQFLLFRPLAAISDVYEGHEICIGRYGPQWYIGYLVPFVLLISLAKLFFRILRSPMYIFESIQYGIILVLSHLSTLRTSLRMAPNGFARTMGYGRLIPYPRAKRSFLAVAKSYACVTRPSSRSRRGSQQASCLHRLSFRRKKIPTVARYWRKQ